VTNNHQEKNARVMEKRGAAIVLLENHCDAKAVFDMLTELLADQQRLSDMSANLRSMAVLDCADRICDMIENLAAGKQG
jgi:UDP-N-acetylglucosamine--N-acetylmuramyl-(pentapeptide) pyrophosphoryl-undecaprenol N-acetylglucosamine transferase